MGMPSFGSTTTNSSSIPLLNEINNPHQFNLNKDYKISEPLFDKKDDENETKGNDLINSKDQQTPLCRKKRRHTATNILENSQHKESWKSFIKNANSAKDEKNDEEVLG